MSRPATPRPHLLAGFLAAFLLALAAPPGASAQEIGVLVSPGPLARRTPSSRVSPTARSATSPERRSPPNGASRATSRSRSASPQEGRPPRRHRRLCELPRGARWPRRRASSAQSKSFNHAEETGFALDGKHAAIATNCEKCHKTRSFLGLRPDCASCHADPHKGALGTRARPATRRPCRSRDRPASTTRRPRSRSEGHRTVACAKCHVNKVYRGVKFAACTDCHTDPHRQKFALPAPPAIPARPGRRRRSTTPAPASPSSESTPACSAPRATNNRRCVQSSSSPAAPSATGTLTGASLSRTVRPATHPPGSGVRRSTTRGRRSSPSPAGMRRSPAPPATRPPRPLPPVAAP